MLWGFILGFVCLAPRRVPAWKIGLPMFVVWEIWENVIEASFAVYGEGYYGDSLINSVMDILPSMFGVWLGRHFPQIWPAMLMVEV